MILFVTSKINDLNNIKTVFKTKKYNLCAYYNDLTY